VFNHLISALRMNEVQIGERYEEIFQGVDYSVHYMSSNAEAPRLGRLAFETEIS
jgi:hypothetical protein